MLCQRCGEALQLGARFCAACGTAIAPPPAVGAPPARSKRPALIVAGAGCVALILCAALAVLAGPWLLDRAGLELDLPLGNKPGAGGGVASGQPFLREGASGEPALIVGRPAVAPSPAALPPDQALTKATFGRPPGFRIVFGSDPASGKPVRVETWLYPRDGAGFVFRDGRYADSTDIPREPAVLRANTTRPETLSEKVTLAGLRVAHGVPLFQIDLPTKGGKLTAFHFANGLVAGFDQATGDLRFAEQLAAGGGK